MQELLIAKRDLKLSRVLKKLNSKNPIETLVISEFGLSRLTVDLWKSLEQNEIKGKSRTIARSLIERLDFAQRWGYGEIDIM